MSERASRVAHRLDAFGRAYATTASLLLSALLLLAALELGVRLLLPRIEPPRLGANTLVTAADQAPVFERHPFAAFTWVPNARFARQTVNGDGFVSTPQVPLEKAAGELRIVTLGGSSTVGLGNADDDTYPRVLERLLRARFPDAAITVINAAAGGYATPESLGYLQSRLVHYRPDVVVVMHAWNDMYYFALDDVSLSRWRENLNVQALWDPNAPRHLAPEMPADLRYLDWSQLYLHLADWRRRAVRAGEDPLAVIERQYEYARVSGDGQRLVIDERAVNPNAPATYERNLRQIHNLCRDEGMHCFTVLQPTLFHPSVDRNDARIRDMIATGALYHGFGFERHLELFERLYEIQRRVFAPGEVIDARGMSGDTALFFDHIHPNAEGCRALARVVAEAIAPAIAARLGRPLVQHP